jgi:hypothetical protein
MPKVTKEYKLPEERAEYEMDCNAQKYYGVLWDFDQYLRNEIKYNNAPKEYEIIREELWRLLSDENISLDQ